MLRVTSLKPRSSPVRRGRSIELPDRGYALRTSHEARSSPVRPGCSIERPERGYTLLTSSSGRLMGRLSLAQGSPWSR